MKKVLTPEQKRINCERVKRLYAADPATFRARSAAQRAKRSPEKVAADAAYMKAYHASHPYRVAAAKRKWQERNRVSANAKSKAWMAAHPELRRDYTRRRRAEQSGASVDVRRTIVAWESGWRSKDSVRCYWCCENFRGDECHVDHVISRPICKKLNAVWHAIGNVCISCGPCNLKKNRRALADWNKTLAQPALL